VSLFGSVNPYGKDTWLPVVAPQLENALGKTFQILDAQDDMRVEGRNIFGKVDIGDSVGNATTPESGDFPAAGDPVYDEYRVTLERISHVVELSFEEFELLNSNDAAAAPVVATKMAKAVAKLKRELVRRMWMSGDAKLARCTPTGPALTITLSAVDGSAGSASQIDRDRFNWIAQNRLRLDLVDSVTGNPIASGLNRTVVSVNRATNVVTLDTAGGNVTTTATTVVVWSGAVLGGGTYTSREFSGLLGALSTNNIYLNIDRTVASKQYWQSNVIPGSVPGTNEIIGLNQIMKLVNTIALNADDAMQPGVDTHFACSNFGVQAAMIEYLAPGIRYTVQQDPDFVASRTSIQRGGIPVLGMESWADVHAFHNNLVIINKSKMAFLRPKRPLGNMFDFVPGQIQDIWQLKVGSVGGRYAAAGQAILTGLVALYTSEPNAHGRLDDVAELGV
jgi:hypothetical protein